MEETEQTKYELVPDKPKQPELIVGCKVIKRGDTKYGGYEWRGIVCSLFRTPHGLERVVVAHKADQGYVLHIYRPDQLKIMITEQYTTQLTPKEVFDRDDI